MSDEQLQRTTPGAPTGAEITSIRGKSLADGVIKRIVSGETTPEEEIEKAEIEMGKPKYVLPSTSARRDSYIRSCDDRALSEANKQPFIYPGFTDAGDFYLSRGMTLVGACSGCSKSTTAANILAGFLKHEPDSVALVISNEENTDSIIHRTACVLLEKNYMAFHKGDMWKDDARQVREFSLKILERIVVVGSHGWDTTCLEDVTDILESCVPQAVSLVMIDYYQTICHSRDRPEMEHYAVLKEFGKFIRGYGRTAPIPVVILCQLHPKSTASEFQARVQYDKTIYNDAFNAIEIEPDFQTHVTKFTVHKNRFGTSQGKSVSLVFNCGRYEQAGGL